jgi:tricarballylate dehydrogenase
LNGPLRAGVRERYDVVVAGGGNAGICAAIAAAETGASVLLVESAAIELRGGNSKYTRNVRFASDTYSEARMLEDLITVTGEDIDLALARFTIAGSRSVPLWMNAHGMLWQAALRGTLHMGGTNHFFLGGGKALLNTYYRFAERLDIEILYETSVVELEATGNVFRGAILARANQTMFVAAGAFVAAAGGYEANREWLRREWGDAVDEFRIRGARTNDGRLLRALLELGAERRGNPRGFHAIAVDARSPEYDGGIATRVDSLPLGIVVNRAGRRFYDEGEDLWTKRYAIWGRLIAEQENQTAFSIFDSRVRGRFVPPCYPPHGAQTVEALAAKLGLESSALCETVSEYNAHLNGAPYDAGKRDGCGTVGLVPPKTNWALPIDRPPFYAYELRPGITFTYLGVAVDERARVLRAGDGARLNGIYAAGEIMAGNMLTKGYLGGFGMTIGTLFGSIAGKEAAQYAGSRSR